MSESSETYWLRLTLLSRLAQVCTERVKAEQPSFAIVDSEWSRDEEFLQYRRVQLLEAMRGSCSELFVSGCFAAFGVKLTEREKGRHLRRLSSLGETLFAIQALDRTDKEEISFRFEPELGRGLLLGHAAKDIRDIIEKVTASFLVFRDIGKESRDSREAFTNAATEAFLGWVKLRICGAHDSIEERFGEEIEAFLLEDRKKSLAEMSGEDFVLLLDLAQQYPLRVLEKLSEELAKLPEIKKAYSW